MSSPDSHTLFQTQLGLRDAGLLTEEEEASLAEHLGGCESCRETIEADSEAGESGEARGEHIPSAMLARWDQVRASAQGLERELLSRHLASCESCREELELVGHEAMLPGKKEESADIPSDGADLDRSARVATLTPQFRRRAWIQGALAGAVLTAAATAVILRPPSTTLDPETLPWVVPGTTRGSAPAIEIPSGARRVLLAIPTPASLSPEQQLRLTVTGPSGAIQMDQDLAPDLLQSPTIMAVLSAPDPLEPGIYTVRLSPEGGGDPYTSSFRISVSDR